MKSPFERLYNTPVSLLLIKMDDYSGETEETELGAIMADVQPYNGGLANKDYGLEAECQKRMFCGSHDTVAEGNHAEINGELYRIIYTEEWDMGKAAILKHENINRGYGWSEGSA